MDAHRTLIRIYLRIHLLVCRRYRHRLRAAVRRQSNNSRPGFTDEEVLTVYLFGIIKKRRTVSDMYTYTSEHFGEWFPELPSYAASNLCGLQSAPEPTRRRVCSACAGSAGLTPGSENDLVALCRVLPTL